MRLARKFAFRWRIVSSDSPRAILSDRFRSAPRATPEPLSDVCDDGLRSVPHLPNVQERRVLRSINELIELLGRLLGGIEYIEISEWHDAHGGMESPVVRNRFTAVDTFPLRAATSVDAVVDVVSARCRL